MRLVVSWPLSKIEEELFNVIETRLNYSGLTKEEWQAVRSLADGRSIVIKKADKSSSIVIWDRLVYLKEPNKQLSYKKQLSYVEFKKKMLTVLHKLTTSFLRTLG